MYVCLFFITNPVTAYANTCRRNFRPHAYVYFPVMQKIDIGYVLMRMLALAFVVGYLEACDCVRLLAASKLTREEIVSRCESNGVLGKISREKFIRAHASMFKPTLDKISAIRYNMRCREEHSKRGSYYNAESNRWVNDTTSVAYIGRVNKTAHWGRKIKVYSREYREHASGKMTYVGSLKHNLPVYSRETSNRGCGHVTTRGEKHKCVRIEWLTERLRRRIFGRIAPLQVSAQDFKSHVDKFMQVCNQIHLLRSPRPH